RKGMSRLCSGARLPSGSVAQGNPKSPKSQVAISRSFLDEIGNSREPPLAGQVVHGLEEALQAIEALLTFDGLELFFMRLAGLMPSPGDERGIGADVLTEDEAEAGLLDQLLVESGGHEQEQTNRAPQRQFLVGHRTADDDRVGEDGPATPAQHP